MSLIVQDCGARRIDDNDGETVRVSLVWGAVAIATVAALAVMAPAGAWLLAFLAVVIVVHEGGHWWVARRAGMRPTEFFWGFGPEVASYVHRGCRYGIKVFPFGGYVKLEGMTPTSELPAGFAESGSFRAARHRDRLATVLAGPAVNLVTALGAFAAAWMLQGTAFGPAIVAGANDVWSIVSGTAEAFVVLATNLGGYIQALIGGQEAQAAAPVRFMSPVSQADFSQQAVTAGPVMVLRWFGVLSAAIGALNLLPLPPLDGSHALVATVEGLVQRVRGRQSVVVDIRRLVPLAWLTLAGLVMLSVSALVMDLRDLAAL